MASSSNPGDNVNVNDPLNYLERVTFQSGIEDANGNVLSDFSGASYSDEDAQDAVGSMADSTLDYNDAAPSLSVASSVQYSDEKAQDAVGTILGANFTYNDGTPSIVLASDTVTVAGNAVALGGTTTVDHADLSNIGSNDHHAKYTDEEAQDAVGNNLGDGLSYDDATPEFALNVVATGSVALSGGAATIDTGVSEATTATFMVALGPDTDDAEVTASIDANSGGNYEVHLDEINTSVGNPTVEYDIIRVR